MIQTYGLTEVEIEDELADRIAADIAHHGGALPERAALAWSGYLGACIEWAVISVDGHDRLRRLLPPIEDDPAAEILAGRSAG